MADLDVVVVGGGVVGLAVAASLAEHVDSLVLFEQHEAFGRETSSRNSEVVHAGIYYPEDSLKARLCVQGRRALYAYCQAHGIPHRKCGKIIVATNDEQEAELVGLKAQGEANDVEGLQLLSAAEVQAREPHVAAVAGLLSPESGILNVHALMDALAGAATAADADLVCGAEVLGLERVADGWGVAYKDSEEQSVVSARVVVNAAGLGAGRIMAFAGLDDAAMGLTLHLCKGEYFSVQGEKRKRVSSLVYPTPRANLLSLGIHTVIGLAGELKLGPSAFYVDRIDYAVDPGNRQGFFEDVRAYLPFLELEDLVPDMSGIRPKLAGPGEPVRDFHIVHETDAGAPGFFNLVGIESPGLTASLAIGEHVAGMVRAYLA